MIKTKQLTLIISTLLLLTTAFVSADIPKFDVISISWNDKTYYLQIETRGLLRDNDLNYYGYSKQDEQSVEEVIEQIVERRFEIQLFQSLEVINLKKFKGFLEEEEHLFILKNSIDVNTKDLKCNYEIVSAVNGNTYGYTYSSDLKEVDNYWIADYPMELLIQFSDKEICDMALYGIKGNVMKEEVEEIKNRMAELFKEGGKGYDEFETLLSELYERHIIMLGFCSC